MTREQAKKILPIMQAYAEGKDIQIKRNTGIWEDLNCPEFDDYVSEYRIKLKPRYRPFKDGQECEEESYKHSDNGWVRDKFICKTYVVLGFYPQGVDLANANLDARVVPWVVAFDNITFMDGQPFGILES